MHFTPTYLDVGFEKMLLCEQDGDGRWDDDYHRYLMRHGLADRLDLMDQRREYRREAPQEYWNTFGAMASNLPEEHHSTTWIGRQAEEAASAFTADGGSFLMVGFVKPHHPFDPPAEWLSRYDESNMEIPRSWTEAPLPRDAAWSQGYFPHAKLTEAALRRIMAHYYATISNMDYWVGRIIASLEESGSYENTMIVFTADHGEYLGFHHLLLKGGPLYEPLVRVPLLVKSAGNSSAERPRIEAGAMCSNTDIGAMILAACDLGSAPPGLGGEPHGRDYVCAHAPSRGAETASAMVRSRRYKFMRGPVETMFFDLDLDPHELNNAILNPEYRDVVAEHEATLTEFEGGEAPRPDAFTDPDAPTVKPEHGYEPDRETVIDYFRSAMGSH
jgi:arylsulfatase A-like enzyme